MHRVFELQLLPNVAFSVYRKGHLDCLCSLEDAYCLSIAQT